MTSAISHRGPDSEGSWSDADNGIHLGHRRLAIQDLTSTGAQPMTSGSGRYVVVYNGELYNHLELRNQLAGDSLTRSWRGSSDTETLLGCFDCWGIEKTLQKINGMFAIALWDTLKNQLTLARDRLGEKPLYYANVNGHTVFASELRSITQFPGAQFEIDQHSLGKFLQHSNIPAPHSIYQGVFKLQAGSYLTIDSNAPGAGDQIRYWKLEEVACSDEMDSNLPIEHYIEILKQQLEKSVSSRLISDVPLGAFLSGGFDSSLVTAIMQKYSSGNTKTFSIGFQESSHNEAPHAKRVAEYLGTDHTEFYVGVSDAIELIPKLGALWDEPFSDSSQIPTYLLSALTRKEVTVALSGDGGDEFFCGYKRYQDTQDIWARLEKYPQISRDFFAKISTIAKPCANWPFPKTLRSRLRWLVEMRTLYSCTSQDELYAKKSMHMKDPSDVLLRYENSSENSAAIESEPDDFIKRMMLKDGLSYLPNTILTKVDRASMAVGLETRAPLLDHELVELAWKIPMEYKLRNGEGKWLLRQVLYSYIPEELVNRPKMGFAVPIADWLRGALRDWADELLSADRLSDQNIFNVTVVSRMWHEHKMGIWDWHYCLWDILMFQSWYEHQQLQLKNLR